MSPVIKQDLSTPADLSLGSWEPTKVSPAKGKDTQAPSTVRTSTAAPQWTKRPPTPPVPLSSITDSRFFQTVVNPTDPAYDVEVERHFASKADFLKSLSGDIPHDRSTSGGADSAPEVDPRGAGVSRRIFDPQPDHGEPSAVAAVEDGAAPDGEGGESAAAQLWGDTPPTFCYLAGAAGSGKTWLASQWAAEAEGLELLASTGIAAINIGGTTINAYLGYFDTKSLQESYTTGFLSMKLRRLWRAGLRRMIVDECSMMSGDQLGFIKRAIDEVNGKGYQLDAQGDVEDDKDLPELGLTVVGDFMQLGPINEPFAFESPEWAAFRDNTITLTTVRRQADAGFIETLRAARRGDGRAVRDFFAGKLSRTTDDAFQGSTLFAKNDAVDRYNWIRMGKLTGSEILFMNLREGEQRSEWGNPKKPSSTWGIPPRLVLKPGALVMVLANKRAELGRGFEYVNGDLGVVEDADLANNVCQVKLHRTGAIVPVQYVRREKKAPCDSARRRELRASGLEHTISDDGKWEITGWVSYMPLRVAYGSTIHKAQGLSLDAVQINISDPFFKTPGMMYVGLSRCRTAEGLRIVGTEAALIERCTVNPKLKGYL